MFQGPQKHSSSSGRLLSKQSSTESGPSSSNRLSRQSSSETTGGGPARNPYQSWYGTPRADANRRSVPGARANQLPNGPDLNSLPRRSQHRRSVTGQPSLMNADPASSIPLIEYSLVENGLEPPAGPERIYSTLDRAGRVGARPKLASDNRRFDHVTNHIDSRRPPLGNHVDSEAAEAEDYYPDTCDPQPHPVGGGGVPHGVPHGVPRGPGGYVKYNSFANY